jgi:hypothetical protein
MFAMAARRRQEAEAERKVALEQVEFGPDHGWAVAAFDELRDLLAKHRTFHVDDFWLATKLHPPTNRKALGPVMMKAARLGLMEKTGEFRPSVSSHLSVKVVWRSLVAP